MVRRICPICDQMMKSAHYCSNCKAFVKNPYIRNTDYYLNERHPADAHDCDYHDNRWDGMQSQDTSAQSGRASYSQGNRRASGQSGRTASGQWREVSGQTGQAAGSFTQPKSGTSGRTGKGRSGRGKSNSVVILVIVLIFLAVEFAVPVLFQLIHMMRWWF